MCMVISVWVTDAWRVLQAICQEEIYTNMIILCYVISVLFSPQSGDTALHDASRYGCLEVVKLLLQSHADVNGKNKVSIESCTSLASSILSLQHKSGNINFAVTIIFSLQLRQRKLKSQNNFQPNH